MTDHNQSFILPLQQKIFSFTAGLTAQEFFAVTPALTKLMQQRLRELRIPVALQDFFISYPDILHFALLVSEDAPGTAIILPLWMRITQLSPRFSLRIFRDTDNLNLLNQITDDLDLNEDLAELELPLCLLFDEEWNYQAQWGPQPQEADPLLDQWFEQHGEYEALAEDETPEAQQKYALLIQELVQQMRIWYNSGLDRASLQEICDLLVSLREDDEREGNQDEER